jgi:hypothetical protein
MGPARRRRRGGGAREGLKGGGGGGKKGSHTIVKLLNMGIRSSRDGPKLGVLGDRLLLPVLVDKAGVVLVPVEGERQIHFSDVDVAGGGMREGRSGEGEEGGEG